MAANKKQWCEKHWNVVRLGVGDGTYNGIAAAISLVEQWIGKHNIDGDLPQTSETEKLNRMMQKESPLCCWLGDEYMEIVYAESRDAARPAGSTE